MATICYVDGLNLYYGLNKGEWRDYLWLDIPVLASKILERLAWKDDLVSVKYFTTPMLGDPAKAKRQATYLSALATNPIVSVRLGKMIETEECCPVCQGTYTLRHEKETDTGIAAELVRDAAVEKPNGALLIAGDSDYAPPFRILKESFPGICTLLAKPPNRGPCDRLRNYCDRYMRIKRDILEASQFPNEVETEGGIVLRRPTEFRQGATT